MTCSVSKWWIGIFLNGTSEHGGAWGMPHIIHITNIQSAPCNNYLRSPSSSQHHFLCNNLVRPIRISVSMPGYQCWNTTPTGKETITNQIRGQKRPSCSSVIFQPCNKESCLPDGIISNGLMWWRLQVLSWFQNNITIHLHHLHASLYCRWNSWM